MMIKMTVESISVVIVCIILLIVTYFWRNHMIHKLFMYLQKEEYILYLKTLDSFSCKYLFPVFLRESMRLNAYMLQGDMEQVKHQFDILLHQIRLTKKQELDIVTKAFYFYVDDTSKKEAKDALQRLKKLSNSEQFIQKCQEIYDVFLEKSSKHIIHMEQTLQQMTGIEKGMYHYMLALQYQYEKNTQKEMEHLACASEQLKDTPYHEKIEEMIIGRK